MAGSECLDEIKIKAQANDPGKLFFSIAVMQVFDL
jgi:hypothetical protein